MRSRELSLCFLLSLKSLGLGDCNIRSVEHGLKVRLKKCSNKVLKKIKLNDKRLSELSLSQWENKMLSELL